MAIGDGVSPIWLEAKNLVKEYRRGPHSIRAVDGVDFSIRQGEFVALVGASGSGKSTILNLLAGLDRPTGGSIEVEGTALSSLSRQDLARYRANRVGMVFQSFHLIPHRTALQNVELALYFGDAAPRDRKTRARSVLERLGLGERLDHRPADLSGGEQQRVAIARALVKEPQILFTDEPTGNLDRENADQIAEALVQCGRQGLAILLVTHDLGLAHRCAHRIVRLDYGKIVEETRNPEGTPCSDPIFSASRRRIFGA